MNKKYIYPLRDSNIDAIINAQPCIQGIDWCKEVDNCLHKNCPECRGNGVKLNGEICIHMISCPCPRCTPRC